MCFLKLFFSERRARALSFEMEKTIKDKEGNERKEWDFDRFDPAFFSIWRNG